MYVDRKLHAHTFLPAGKLGISQPLYDALIEVRRRLLSGEITQSNYVSPPRDGGTVFDELTKDEGARFSYRIWGEPNACGTTACIGGWVEILTGLDTEYETSPALHALFYDGKFGTTPMEAAKAIENVLHGKNVWGGVYASRYDVRE